MDSSLYTSKYKDKDAQQLFQPNLSLTIHCTKLPLPCYLRIFHKNPILRNNWVLIKVTQLNDVEPTIILKDCFQLRYNFNLDQEIRIELHQLAIDECYTIASSCFHLSEVFTSPNSKLPLQLFLSEKQIRPQQILKSYLEVEINEIAAQKDLVRLKFKVEFTKKQLFQRTTCYKLWKNDDQSHVNQIIQSEYRKGRQPVWSKIQLRIPHVLRDNNIIRFTVYDKADKVKGNSEFTFSEVLDRGKREFPLLKFESKKSKGNQIVNKGTVKILETNLGRSTTFCDFLMNNIKLRPIYCIDYLGFYSELDNSEQQAVAASQNPSKLQTHSISSPELFLSQISFILKYCHNIVSPYFSTQKSTLYAAGVDGFDDVNKNISANDGGQTKLLSQDFEVESQDSIDLTIQQMFENISSTNKLYLAPIIQNIIKTTKEEQRKSQTLPYVIVYITLASKISDFKATLDSIIQSSHEIPISYCFLGLNQIGSQQFTAIQNDLDKLTNSDDQQIRRSCISFVDITKYMSLSWASMLVLNDIPMHIWQFADTFKLHPTSFLGKGYRAYKQFCQGDVEDRDDIDQLIKVQSNEELFVIDDDTEDKSDEVSQREEIEIVEDQSVVERNLSQQFLQFRSTFSKRNLNNRN